MIKADADQHALKEAFGAAGTGPAAFARLFARIGGGAARLAPIVTA
ncbi:MAG TPA: hypothetical protein PKC12_00110 [Thiobacillaceae bacterium]|nr:hypothetical protein [Thiobacillaceae bacterium]